MARQFTYDIMTENQASKFLNFQDIMDEDYYFQDPCSNGELSVSTNNSILARYDNPEVFTLVDLMRRIEEISKLVPYENDWYDWCMDVYDRYEIAEINIKDHVEALMIYTFLARKIVEMGRPRSRQVADEGDYVVWVNYMKTNSHSSNYVESTIQKSIKESIFNVMKTQPMVDVFDSIENDSILTPLTKRLIVEYCADTFVYPGFHIAFKDLLSVVWTRIQSHAAADEIKRIMNVEIADAQHTSFIGRVARLLNCLVGFCDDVYFLEKSKTKIIPM